MHLRSASLWPPASYMILSFLYISAETAVQLIVPKADQRKYGVCVHGQSAVAQCDRGAFVQQGVIDMPPERTETTPQRVREGYMGECKSGAIKELSHDTCAYCIWVTCLMETYSAALCIQRNSFTPGLLAEIITHVESLHLKDHMSETVQ